MRGDWHYLEDGVKRGPVKDADLQELVSANVIPEHSQVWRPGMAEWTEAAELLRGEATAEPARNGALLAPARKQLNGLLIAWQVLYLLGTPLWLAGDAFLIDVGSRLGLLGDLSYEVAEGMSVFTEQWQGAPLVAVTTGLSAVCVIAMFWRKRWAVYGFIAINLSMCVFSIYQTYQTAMAWIGFEAVWFLSAAAAGFALFYLMAVLLLVGAIKLGEAGDAGWSTFD